MSDASTSVFAASFEVVGFHHERCAPPDTKLLEQRSCRSHNGQPPLGKFQIATFLHAGEAKLYCRLYHFDSQETAWYSMTATRETLAKIAYAGDGDKAAKL